MYESSSAFSQLEMKVYRGSRRDIGSWGQCGLAGTRILAHSDKIWLQRLTSIFFSYISFVAIAWLLFGQPLSAQQPAPTLQVVLDEASNALKSLAEREASVAFSFEPVLARANLSYAFIRVGELTKVDDLFSDEAEKKQALLTIESMLAEATGEVSEFASDLAPMDELLRRQLMVMALAKRGDFKAANDQVAAFPKYPKLEFFEIEANEFLAERQIEQQSPAAGETIRRLWRLIRDADGDAQRKAERMITLAKMTSQAGEQEPARKLCISADKMLTEFLRTPERDVERTIEALRSLAIAYAMIGNADRARELLETADQEAELIDVQDEAQRLFTSEEYRARVAHIANKNDAALAAYARALKWAQQIYQNEQERPADPLDDVEFVSSLISLMEGANFRTVALGQLEAGDQRAALETWQQMPLCVQKLATILELAKLLHKRGEVAEARQLAAMCAELDLPDSPAEDHVLITSFVANIFRTIGDEQESRATLAKLLGDPRIEDSLEAKQLLVSNLIDFQMFAEAYAEIQQIEATADRAVSLATLAKEMANAADQ
jgi:tetratricopeptide (TPR) repeat protein